MSKPFIVAGPCSAETREQLHQTAKLLKQYGVVDVFRAGIWKPRTRPGSFEGSGEKAIDWLMEVQKDFALPVCIEVLNTKQAEIALKAGISWMWLGARTTVNPYSVKEIASVLMGTGVNVLVKNPINPDVQLWLGAIERIRAANVKSVYAVHRGFTVYPKTPYRNAPLWSIPIELKTLLPDIPVLCDPSHICGKRELIPAIVQKAFDLGFNGLMIESHYKPSEALTDARQQLRPEALKQILDSTRKPDELSNDPNFNQTLTTLRTLIDDIDNNIIEALAQRMEVVGKIALHKKENQISVLQVKRWSDIFKTRMEKGKELGLNPDFLNKLLKLVHEESIELQSRIINDNKNSSLQ